MFPQLSRIRAAVSSKGFSMKITTVLAALATSVAFGSTAALAGGVVAPIVEPAPVVAPVAEIGAWEGAYAGGSLGYSFRGNDRVGLALREDDVQTGRATDLTRLRVSGPTAGLHVGYRWQRDRWVFGPELAIEGGSVKDDGDFVVDGVPGNAESRVKNTIALVAKTGYAIDPQTLFFGTFGVTRMSGEYTLTGPAGSQSESYSASGLTAGFGVERMINPTTSVFAAYEYRDYGRTGVDFPVDGAVLRTEATPRHNNIKLGVNFRF